jgi:hypothetical protein
MNEKFTLLIKLTLYPLEFLLFVEIKPCIIEFKYMFNPFSIQIINSSWNFVTICFLLVAPSLFIVLISNGILHFQCLWSSVCLCIFLFNYCCCCCAPFVYCELGVIVSKPIQKLNRKLNQFKLKTVKNSI